MNGQCRHRVGVEVSTGWTSPSAPREVDAPAVADSPDMPQWLAALDELGPEGRLDLNGRTVTQLVADEPVEVLEESGAWAHVVAPWQLSPLHPRGYPAWVPRAHLAPLASDPTPPPGVGVRPDRLDIAHRARRHLGLRYLWGGTTPYGLDCSGLLHLTYREAGVVVPRDADAQQAAALDVPLGDERPGDLYFFARPDGHVFHVGFVTGRGTMLHASGSELRVVETMLSPERDATLSSAGRFLTS